MNFYEKFLYLCDEWEVSKQKACSIAGLSGNAWIRWSNGSHPGTVSLRKICNYFNVTTESMINDSMDIVYADDGMAARQQAFDRPEMKILFDAAADAPASAILEAALNLMKLKESNTD